MTAQSGESENIEAFREGLELARETVTAIATAVKEHFPAPASGWQDERTNGWGDMLWLSIDPALRDGRPAVMPIWVASFYLRHDIERGEIIEFDSLLLVGAKWKRREQPEDPFKVAP